MLWAGLVTGAVAQVTMTTGGSLTFNMVSLEDGTVGSGTLTLNDLMASGADSYTSGERVAAMIVAAAFGVGLRGGQQVGYASLVDLNTGNVVWFNLLRRVSGDLREPERAKESLDALLRDFPDR